MTLGKFCSPFSYINGFYIVMVSQAEVKGVAQDGLQSFLQLRIIGCETEEGFVGQTIPNGCSFKVRVLAMKLYLYHLSYYFLLPLASPFLGQMILLKENAATYFYCLSSVPEPNDARVDTYFTQRTDGWRYIYIYIPYRVKIKKYQRFRMSVHFQLKARSEKNCKQVTCYS